MKGVHRIDQQLGLLARYRAAWLHEVDGSALEPTLRQRVLAEVATLDDIRENLLRLHGDLLRQAKEHLRMATLKTQFVRTESST